MSLWTDESGVTDDEGGIWQSGGGLMADAQGHIFVATGNGVSPAPGSGTSPPAELGDSVVRLNVGSDGTLTAADFFSPSNAPDLDADDRDFGSGGPLGLPFGTASVPDLLVQAGKDGRVFLLNRDSLGGRQAPGQPDADVSQSGPYAGQWGHPAAFGPDAAVSAATSDDYVYYVGQHDQLRYLQFGVDGSTPELTNVASSSTVFGYTSGSPVVTSNGSDPASAVVWAVNSPDNTGAGATLQAFPAVPDSTCTAAAQCTISPIWSAPIGTASKFTVPATDAGRVYVTTRDGSVLGFGSPDSAPLAGAPVDFGLVSAGKTRAATITLTAASQVTVAGISASVPFKTGAATVNGAPVSFPVSLNPADALAVPVTFAPARAGGVTGALTVATNAANFPAVNVGLSGRGTAPGLYASAGTVSFGTIAARVTVTRPVILTNGSASPLRITALTKPTAPFGARLPAVGKVLASGQSVVVPVTFRPARAGASASAFTVTTTGGRKITVRLAGTGKAAVSKLTVTPGYAGFGSVPLGNRATRTVVLTNAGDLPATITAVTGLAAPFGLQVVIPAGLPVNPGYTIALPLSFAPTGPGAVSSRLAVHWRDQLGSHAVTVGLGGTGTSPTTGRAVPPPGGGWTLNGTAAVTGSQLVLTRGRQAAGSAVYPVPQAASGLRASFLAQLRGAGGMTLSLLDATTATPSVLGGNAGKFGAGGRRGVAIVLGTHRYAGDPSGNFAAVAAISPRGLTIVQSTSRIPALRTGQTAVSVSVSGRRVRVRVGGAQVLSVLLRPGVLPASVLTAFTGGTGAASGSQAVLGASVTGSAGPLPPPGGGWSFNAAAGMSVGSALLTRAVPSAAGSAVYPAAVPTAGLQVTFTARLAGGSGGNGLTFALLDPATATARSVGKPGYALGFGGLGGVSVALDTVHTTDDGSRSSAYICVSTAGSPALSSLQVARGIPPLRVGLDTVSVQITPNQAGPLMSVWLDGELILRQVVPQLPQTALLAFTGATGAATDVHLVRDVAIRTGS